MGLITQVKILQRVAANKSFSKAAEELGLSKSVVTRAIASLEKEVGDQLLARTTRTVTLTQAGEAYLSRAVALVNELENLSREISGRTDVPRGPLKFGVTASIGPKFITPILPALRQQFPLVEFTFDYSDRPTDSQKSSYDAEIRFGMPDPALNDSIEIRTAREVLMASPEYLRRHPPIRSFADVDLNDVIGFLNTKGTEPTPIFFCEDGARIPRIVTGAMVVSEVDAFHQLLRDGQGISLVIDLFVLDDLKAGRLVEVPVPEKMSYFPYGNSSIYISVPKNVPKSKTTSAVIEFLKARAFYP